MHTKPLSALILCAFASAAIAQTPAPSSSAAPAPAAQPAATPDPAKRAPSEIVAAAPASDWVSIAPEDLLVITLASGRRIVIQLMPPPFSQGWIGNIRKLAAAHWWDGLSINRVQDNYVVQWGDADGEDLAKAKPLPSGLVTVAERDYALSLSGAGELGVSRMADVGQALSTWQKIVAAFKKPRIKLRKDAYAVQPNLVNGWPLVSDGRQIWPVHCYGMVGVGRNLSPDTGSGAELYAVIGHAPRHLDRNIALVGRVIAGIEHLSSLPRGTGALGFYEQPVERTGIASIRLASELPVAEQPRFEFLSTESDSFEAYANARANRRDAFFNVPAGGADICNIPVPTRKKP